MILLKEARQRAENDARMHGYYLHPDPEFLRNLLEGLTRNEDRYGYPSCPCRLASGKFEFDRDILCPCEYRDADLEEFGFCYCALYVRKDVHEGKTSIVPIPERRPMKKQTRAYAKVVETSTEMQPHVPSTESEQPSNIEMKMWYCRQCGYMCFREDPPHVCPICKAKAEIFAEIIITTQVLTPIRRVKE